MERSLRMQPIECETGEFLGHFFRGPIVRYCVLAISHGKGCEKDGYNWPKISDQRCSDGLLEGTCEGLSGEGCAFEESAFSVVAENARLISHRKLKSGNLLLCLRRVLGVVG
jgi:hypothetical protein